MSGEKIFGGRDVLESIYQKIDELEARAECLKETWKEVSGTITEQEPKRVFEKDTKGCAALAAIYEAQGSLLQAAMMYREEVTDRAHGCAGARYSLNRR